MLAKAANATYPKCFLFSFMWTKWKSLFNRLCSIRWARCWLVFFLLQKFFRGRTSMAIERSKVRHDFCETYGNNCQSVDRYFPLRQLFWFKMVRSYLLWSFLIFFLHSDIALSQVQATSGSFCFFSRHKTREILWYLWRLVVYCRVSFTAVVCPITMHASCVDTFVSFIHGFDQSAFPF